MIHRIFDKSIFEKEIMEITIMFRDEKKLALMPDEMEKVTILIDDKKLLSIESTRSMNKEK
jgi:hypothetical protein